MILTPIVDTKMNTTIFIAIFNSGQTRVRGRFSIQLANLSLMPPPALAVAILLHGVVAVKVVHANLLIYISGRRLETCGGLLTIFPSLWVTEANGERGTAQKAGPPWIQLPSTRTV